MSKPVDAGSLKIGSNIVIDGEPCKIVEMDKSKPGKHGSAKVRIVGISLFGETKKSLVCPVDAKVEVPLVEKKSGQVVSISDKDVQLMDLENYEMLYAPMPEDEIRTKLSPGVEVEYWLILGKIKIVRTKGA
jgi:translation initiation factor 5A